MKIGIRAHDFGRMRAEDLAKLISQNALNYIQLAPSKAIEDINDDTILNLNITHNIKSCFDNYNIKIGVLGCYINPVENDLKLRTKQLQRFCNYLSYADKLGCSIVATETGQGYTKVDFENLVKSVSLLIKTAEENNSIVAIEPVKNNTVNSIVKMKELINIIASDNLKVIFDLTNLIDFDDIKGQNKIVNSALELLGDKICAFHLKGVQVVNGVIKQVPLEEGIIDYSFVKIFAENNPDILILMDGIKDIHIKKNIEYLTNHSL